MTNKYLLTTIFLLALYGLWLQPIHIGQKDLNRYGSHLFAPKADPPMRADHQPLAQEGTPFELAADVPYRQVSLHSVLLSMPTSH
ncbi:MAG: hypothetical protein AAFV95_20565 [Bacteroidota bacterium]